MTRLLTILLLALAVCAGSLAPAASAHPEPGDSDGDNVFDYDHPNRGNRPFPDNCPSVRNVTQRNVDGDELGDACDLDDDNDGVLDHSTPPDNCRATPNPGQEDTDQDGVGDACAAASDQDADGVPDQRDNCPAVPNREQLDADQDSLGDSCDDDDDFDDIPDAADNCVGVNNPDQTDRDADGIGTVCDTGESVSTAGAGGAGDRPGSASPPAGGEAPAVDARPADRVPPGLSVAAARTLRRSEVDGGLATAVRCSEACALTAQLTVDRRTARRLRLRAPSGTAARTVVARGVAALGGAGRTFLFVRMRASVSRRVFARRAGRVTARLTVEAIDAGGNRSTLHKTLVLRP